MYILCSVRLGKNIQSILLALKCDPLKLIKKCNLCQSYQGEIIYFCLFISPLSSRFFFNFFGNFWIHLKGNPAIFSIAMQNYTFGVMLASKKIVRDGDNAYWPQQTTNF